MATIYDYKALTGRGQELDFKQFEGKVLLIVNTASKCGFTPQFAGLEELNKQYKDKGLVIIGFPCNQFLSQDPGSDSEISEFCRLNYGVTFQIMKKVDVNGADEEPVFTYLKQQAPFKGFHKAATNATLGAILMLKDLHWKKSNDIKWNFTKFLISKDGKSIRRFEPDVEPAEMASFIEAEL